MGGAFARTLVPDAVTTSSYDAGNRQLTFGGSTLTYDDNGNRLTQSDPSGTITYTWDARNRLTGLTGPGLSASFAYDGVGRRAQKTVNDVLTQFHYDGLDVVQESSGGSEVAYLRTLGIDEALARIDAVDTAHSISDTLGSTVALTNPAGTAATTYTFEPFGRTEISGTPSVNALQYTGRENDSTGLYYYRARYYDPVRARFISEDPIGFRGGINFYRYVRNNPIRFADPFGQDAIVTLWPHSLGGIGHVGIGVNTDQTSGFYSTKRPPCLVLGCNDPGRLLDDWAQHPGETPLIVTIQTTAEDDEAMQAVIDERANTPGNYNLRGRNCAHFVEDVLAAGGVKNVPPTKWPTDLFKALQAIANQH